MTKKIIIVESPSKVKILNSFLGKDYLVTACYGHIRNIPTKSNQVYFENQEVKTNWHYLPSVSKLKEFVEKSKCEEILIATDPDREGERIAMDLRDLWSQNYKIKRITFNAITKEEVLKAIKNPRLVNESKANAAKTRAIIDYYFGFNISPWLWKVLPQAKAMGRVQAPSLHWIVGKELSNLQKKIEYVCTVSLINKEYDIVMKCKYEDFSKFYNDIKGYPLIFRNIDFNSRRSVSQPIEPFNTLTIQKYMSSKFRISAQLLMRYLQDLYAGKISDLNNQSLITYMRTDSKRLSISFIRKTIVYLIRNGLKDKIDWDNIKKLMVNRDKNAQDAHEAIRPILFSLKGVKDQYRYILSAIIKRTLKSFIVPSIYNISYYQIKWGTMYFKSNDFKEILRQGNNEFLDNTKYKDLVDISNLRKSNQWNIKLSFSTNYNYLNYSEGNLISSMQKLGVGRPSTWSQIRFNLSRRFYIDKRMKPESLGFLTDNLMNLYFNEFTLNKFTNYVEERMDEIEYKDKDYQIILNEVLDSIKQKIERTLDIDWSSILDSLSEKNTRYCCGKKAQLYFSKKKKIWLFFSCESCKGILPFDYKPLNILNKGNNTFIKRFLVKGKIIEYKDNHNHNFLSSLNSKD